MNQAENAAAELRAMDDLAAMDSPMHRLHPAGKLVMTLVYILTVVSFHKYDFSGLTVMVLFPVLGYQLSFIPVSLCFRRLRVVLPLVCAVGLANPFFDREILLRLGGIAVSGGVVSMLTLMMKGVFALMASFLLVATTGMDGICMAMRQLHLPKLLTSLIMLTYRYISLLLDEVAIMTQSYHLRAPEQKGIHFRAWGSFLGQLLLRTMDRAQELYEAMELRGFDGEFSYAQIRGSKASVPICAVSCALMLLCRFVPVASLLGRLL